MSNKINFKNCIINTRITSANLKSDKIIYYFCKGYGILIDLDFKSFTKKGIQQ